MTNPAQPPMYRGQVIGVDRGKFTAAQLERQKRMVIRPHPSSPNFAVVEVFSQNYDTQGGEDRRRIGWTKVKWDQCHRTAFRWANDHRVVWQAVVDQTAAVEAAGKEKFFERSSTEDS